MQIAMDGRYGTKLNMRFGRKEAELPLKTSKQDCAKARAKLPPVEPSLCAAQSLMAGMFNTFCRTELKKQVLPWFTRPLGQEEASLDALLPEGDWSRHVGDFPEPPLRIRAPSAS
jgi:hypothetical protein